MRTAIGAAEHRSHLTFLSDGQKEEGERTRGRGPDGRGMAAHFKTIENDALARARARACWFRPFVRHRNYKTVPSSFNFWVDWIVFSGDRSGGWSPS